MWFCFFPETEAGGKVAGQEELGRFGHVPTSSLMCCIKRQHSCIVVGFQRPLSGCPEMWGKGWIGICRHPLGTLCTLCSPTCAEGGAFAAWALEQGWGEGLPSASFS